MLRRTRGEVEGKGSSRFVKHVVEGSIERSGKDLRSKVRPLKTFFEDAVGHHSQKYCLHSRKV